jgi:hypothetical protein
MRFKTFIVEENGIRSQANGDAFDLEQFKRDCAPFILQRKQTDEALWRGIGRGFASAKVGDWGHLDVSKDRRPKDLARKAHQAIDNYFYQKFGWRARTQGLFCSGYRGMAAGYGQVYEVYPVGQVKYLFSEDVGDLYEVWAEIWDDVDVQAEGIDAAVKKFIEGISLGNYTYTNNLQEAAELGVEIMVNCDSYYCFIFKDVNNEGEYGPTHRDIRRELGL